MIWVVGGLYMTAIHIDFIHGKHLVNPVKQAVFSSPQSTIGHATESIIRNASIQF